MLNCIAQHRKYIKLEKKTQCIWGQGAGKKIYKDTPINRGLLEMIGVGRVQVCVGVLLSRKQIGPKKNRISGN